MILKKFMKACKRSRDQHFIFDRMLYKQVYDMVMGTSLSSVLANTF